MKKYLYYIVILTCLSFTSCENNSIFNIDKNDKNKIEFTDFKDFPEKQFLDLTLNDTKPVFEQKLVNHGFKNIHNGESFFYERIEDSTLVIFTNNYEVKEFKVFLKSNFYTSNKEYLLLYFKGFTKEILNDDLFTELTYREENNQFKCLFFVQEDFIRIVFR